MAGRELGHVLLTIARSRIAEETRPATQPGIAHAALAQPGATFVTLKRAGELRGCIGIDPARAPARRGRARQRVAAAFGDPRFPPLAAFEFEKVEVEVSLLTADEPIDVVDEDDLLERLRPGLDGLILEFGQRRATFLPQVWDALPDPREFLTALKRKAGLPDGFLEPANERFPLWRDQMGGERDSDV